MNPTSPPSPTATATATATAISPDQPIIDIFIFLGLWCSFIGIYMSLLSQLIGLGNVLDNPVMCFRCFIYLFVAVGLPGVVVKYWGLIIFKIFRHQSLFTGPPSPLSFGYTASVIGFLILFYGVLIPVMLQVVVVGKVAPPTPSPTTINYAPIAFLWFSEFIGFLYVLLIPTCFFAYQVKLAGLLKEDPHMVSFVLMLSFGTVFTTVVAALAVNGLL